MPTLPSWPTVVHEINTRAPNDPLGTDNWIDVTAYVSKFSIQRGRSDELTSMGPSTMTWETRGTDGRWDPDNAGTLAAATTQTDSSSGGHNGTLVGSVLPTTTTSPWSGFGQALVFDGVGRGANTSGVDLGTSTGLCVSGVGAAATFCIEAKVRIGSSGASGVIVERANTSGGGGTLQPGIGGGVGATFFVQTRDNGGTYRVVNGTTTALANTSYEVAGAYDGTTLRLYVNGTMENSLALSGVEAPTAGIHTYIGRIDDATNPNPFSGTVDEVRISNTARGHTGASYTPATTPFTSDANTLGLWHLDDTTGSAASPYYPYLTAWRQARTSAMWPQPTTYATDAFHRTTNASSLTTADSGQAWTNLLADLGVQANTCECQNSTESIAVLTAGATDVLASITVTTTLPQPWSVLARCTDVNNFYMAQISSTGVTLWKRVAGTTTQLGSTFAHTWGSGDVLGVQTQGTTISAVLNGTTVISVTDSALSSGTKAGIRYAGGGFTGTQITQFTVTNLSVTYRLFTGYNTDGWTTAFASRGRREYGKAQFSDALAVLERIGLLDVTLAEMLADGPLALYPLDESGGTQAGNRSAFKQATISPALGVGSTTTGGGPVTVATITSTAGLGGPGIIPNSSASLVLTTVGAAGFPLTPWSYQGPTITLPASGSPTSGGATLVTWMKLSTLPTNGSVTFISQANAAVTEGIQVVATTAGLTLVIASVGSGTVTATSTVHVDDGNVHHVEATLSADGKTLTVYVDGASVGTAAVGSALTQANLTPPQFGYLLRSVSAGGGPISTASSMSLEYVGTYSTPLSGARVAAHYKAGIDAFYGDTPAVRIARLLSYPKWLTALQNLDTTSVGELNTPLLGATGLDGVTVAAELLHIADSTMSDVDVDGSGRVRYRSRDYRLLQTTPSVIFGPNTGAGEIPYSEPAPEIGKNPKFTYPQVQVQQRNGLTALGSDATAVLNNFEQMLTKSDVILADPSMVLDYRDDLLRRYKAGHNRATPVTLNPAANPTIWPAVLGLDTAQRCRVNVTPQTAPAKSVEGYVEAFTHEVDPTSSTPWNVTVTTSAAPPFFPWILGDATYGVLGVTTIPVF